MEPSRSRSTTDASSRFNARSAFDSRRSSPIRSRATEVPGELDVIAKLVELIPVVGPWWADALQSSFGIADAMNLQRLRNVPSLPVERDRKIAFLY